MHDLPPRTPWPPGFPEVVIHAELGVRDAMPAYHAAKRGSAQAALKVAHALVSDQACEQLATLARLRGTAVRLVAVTAREAAGINLIPEAMADQIAQRTGLQHDRGNVVQINKVSHTRAKSLRRLVTPAEFGGRVIAGADYIILDDHVGLGGTLTNLRGWIESQGGRVLAASCLTASPSAQVLAIGQSTLDMLLEKYGDRLEPFWAEYFGHGLECLTNREGRALVQARARSVDALAGLLAQAAEEAAASNR